MSHQNGIISATDPVELIDDVKTVLGETTDQLSELCTSEEINEWSKSKPLKIQGTPDRSSAWWRAENTWTNKCGFNIQSYDEGADLGDDAWTYVRPTGGTYPFRLYDFGGYKHTSVCPFSFNLPVESYFDDDGGLTANAIKFTVSGVSSLNLAFADIFSGTWYFGIEVKKGNVSLARTVGSRVTTGQNTLSMEGCSLMLEVGTVTLTAFLSQTMQTTWGGWASGTRYSLNAFGTTSSAQCVVKKIQQNMLYFDVNGLLPSDKDFFTTIGDGSVDADTFNQTARVKKRPSVNYTLYKVTSTIRKFFPASGESVLYSTGEITEDETGIYTSFEPNIDKAEMMPNDIFSFYASKTGLFSAPDSTIDFYYTIAVEFFYRTEDTVVEIDKYDSEMYEGETKTWEAVVSPSETPVDWYCTNEYGYVEVNPICSLSYSGTVCDVTAVRSGRGRIYCRATDGSNKRDYQFVTVIAEGGSDVVITDYPKTPMTVGDRYFCFCEVTPSSLGVVWSVSNELVATITSSGMLTAVGAGDATVYCTAEDGSSGDSVEINVDGGGGGGTIGISVSPTSMTITEGESFTLTGSTSSGGIVWSSSNTRVAYTDKDSGSSVKVYAGTVNGDYETCTITAISKIDNSMTASCSVRVNKAVTIVHVTDISISKARLEIGIDDTFHLRSTISPSNATNKGVTWDTSNDSVASVDGSGNVTGNGKGKATITVTADDRYNGTISASCLVTVKKPVESVSIKQGDITIGIGQHFTYTATVLPYDSTVRTVVWTCSPSSSVISIDSSTGEVVGLHIGDAAVTATCDGMFDTVTVRVRGGETHVASVEIDEGDVTIPLNGRIQLNGIMNTIPAGGGVTPTSQTWTVSNNTANVIISPNGSTCRVTARDTRGRATVTYTVVENGNTFSDSIQVTVGEIQN